MLAKWQAQLSQALLLPQEQPGASGMQFSTTGLSALQGIEQRRLALYQELMLNTLLESVQNIFPFTYQLLSHNGSRSTDWEKLVETYRRAYPNPSHKLMAAVEDFPRFLAGQSQWMKRYPFLSELALYEWLEMQVLNLPDQGTSASLPAALPELGKYSQFAPVWNEARVLQHFEYAVPEIIDLIQTQAKRGAKGAKAMANVQPSATDILFYRDPSTLDVRFFCLNGLTSLLVQLSTAQPGVSYAEILRQLQELVPGLQSLPPEVITEQAAGLFRNCLENGMLLGSNALT